MLQRMDNVAIVVDDLKAVTAFFVEPNAPVNTLGTRRIMIALAERLS